MDHEAEALRRRLAEVEALVRRANHDVRSPLSIVAGLARTLVDHGDSLDPAERRHVLERVAQAAERAMRTVDDVVALVRAGSAAAEEPDAACDVEAVARLLVDDVGAVTGAWAPAAIAADDLHAALGALVDNAHRYGRPPVSVRGEVVGGRLHVVVADAGPGIPGTDRDAVFEPFHRGAGAIELAPDRTGTGLALARAIARAWGGDVTVDDTAAGCAVRLTVPLAD